MFISEDMLYAIKTWATENDVVCVQSLYEADAGLQHLEDMGITDGTFSEDGDFFPLDSKLWATKVSLSKGTLILFNSENIRTALTARLSPSSEVIMTADHGRVLSVLLGSDFLPRPAGFGPKTVEKFIATWMISSEEENNKSLMEIEKGKKKRKNGDFDAQNTDAFPSYSSRFWLAFNMLKHPPVFKFTSLEEGASVNIGLLGIDDLNLSKEHVFRTLGFNALLDVENIGDYRKLLFLADDIFVRTMMPLLPIIQPKNSEGLLLTWGSQLNFDKWPPNMCTSDMLNKWLRARGVRYSPTVAHDELVRSVMALMNEVPQRDIIPVDDIPEEADFGVGPGGVQWNLDGDYNFAQIRVSEVTPPINEEFIDAIFGHRGGVENRAMRLIPGGHFSMSTLKICRITCKRSGVNEECVMYQIKSTPSMKANEYAVNLVFRKGILDHDEVGVRFVRSPYSHCDCPAGQMFCSHMLGFLGILRVIQEHLLLSYSKISALFPPSVKALSSTGILLEYVF